VSHITDESFQEVMSRIGRERRTLSQPEIDYFFDPITRKHGFLQFRDFLANRYRASRMDCIVRGEERVTQNTETFVIEGNKLKTFNKQFSKSDTVVIYFRFTHDWDNIVECGANIANKDMIGGSIGAFLLLPLALADFILEKLRDLARGRIK
jgi:hypothetical protein